MNTSLNFDENNAAMSAEWGKRVFDTTTDFITYMEEPEAWQLEDLDDVILSYD